MKRLGLILFNLGLFIFQWSMAIKGVTGTEWAWNLFMFSQWLFTVLYIFAMIMISLLPKTADERVKTIPNWFCILSDVLLMFWLAAFGHFFFAILTLFQLWIEQIYKGMVDKILIDRKTPPV